MRTCGSNSASGAHLAGCGQGMEYMHQHAAGVLSASHLRFAVGAGHTRRLPGVVVRGAMYWSRAVPSAGSCAVRCAGAAPRLTGNVAEPIKVS